jgi:hypothetical protein
VVSVVYRWCTFIKVFSPSDWGPLENVILASLPRDLLILYSPEAGSPSVKQSLGHWYLVSELLSGLIDWIWHNFYLVYPDLY